MRVCMCAHVFVTTPLVRVVESPLEKFLPHPLMGFAGRELTLLAPAQPHNSLNNNLSKLRASEG